MLDPLPANIDTVNVVQVHLNPPGAVERPAGEDLINSVHMGLVERVNQRLVVDARTGDVKELGLVDKGDGRVVGLNKEQSLMSRRGQAFFSATPAQRP